MGKLLALDRRRVLRPLALQDPASDALLPDGLSDQDKMRSWHLVEDDGRVRSGGRAFAPLLAQLPAGKALARLADRAYYAVADRRSRARIAARQR
jgi:predicted DCC family thiol-disulfide oxidoreductase YuxK